MIQVRFKGSASVAFAADALSARLTRAPLGSLGCKGFADESFRLGAEDSNPHTQIQSLLSYP